MSEAAKADLQKLRIARDSARNDPGRPRPWKRLVTISVVIVLILVAGFWIKSMFGTALEVDISTASFTSPTQANAVLSASGYVVAHRKASIASKGTGRLVMLAVEEGDKVKANQVIARIEYTDVDAALAQAKAGVAVAHAAREQSIVERDDAKRGYDRMNTLFAKRTVSETDFQTAEARFKRAEAVVIGAAAQITSAEANVAALTVQVENTYIRAPFDGTILTKNAEVGEIVAPFATSASSRGSVVTMADLGSIEVEADVSESNIEQVLVGAPVEITLDAIPDHRYHGTVHKVVPTADRAKATVLTRIRFTDVDSRVLPEMSAKILLLKDSSGGNVSLPNVLTVPREAVNGDIVFLMRGGYARKQRVAVGVSLGGMIEVRSGITAGDTVVLHPPSGLADGVRVTVRR
jgi:RND family efflux transporter MFP subunit